MLAHLCRRMDQERGRKGNDTSGHKDDAEIFQRMVFPEGGNVTKPSEGEDGPVEIFYVNIQFPETDRNELLGAYIDSDAQRTVIGDRQADEYIASDGISKAITTSHSATWFKLGDKTYAGIGNIEVRLPITYD